MKFNLGKNKKFLIRLLVIAITYCTNVNAEKFCKWDGCVPMYKKLGFWFKFNENHFNNDNHINEYSNKDKQNIEKECENWMGKWPLNCPMKLTDEPEDNNLMWTDELLQKINKERSNDNRLKCFLHKRKRGVQSIYGIFGEVIDLGLPEPNLYDEKDCEKAYKLHPFLPEFELLLLNSQQEAMLNYTSWAWLNTKIGKLKEMQVLPNAVLANARFSNRFDNALLFPNSRPKVLVRHQFWTKFAEDFEKFLRGINTERAPLHQFFPDSHFISPAMVSKLEQYFKDLTSEAINDPEELTNDQGKNHLYKLFFQQQQFLIEQLASKIIQGEVTTKVTDQGQPVWTTKIA
jgi:hypothetical protein